MASAFTTYTVNDLRAKLTGTLLHPEDEGFSAAKQGWNLIVEQNPAIVVQAATVEDVQEAIRFAAANGRKVQVVTTGHGVPRPCVDEVLISLAKLNSVSINETEKTATVSGGALWGSVLHAAHEIGHTALCGSAATVGVVGYLLGGGYGLLSRKYGLAVDTIRRMSVVKADGSLVTVSPTENEDLFWALSGGGGAFGVVVEVELNLLPLSKFYGGATIYPAELAREVLMAFVDWAETAPEEAMAAAGIYHFPPIPEIPEFLRGKSVVIVNFCVALPREAAEDCLLPLRMLGPAIADTCCEVDAHQVQHVFNDPIDPIPAKSQGALLNDLSKESIEKFLEAVGDIEKLPLVKVDFRLLGGAHHKPDCGTVMSGLREAKFLMTAIVGPNPHVPLDVMVSFGRRVIEAMDLHDRCPLTFIGEGSIDHAIVKASLGDQYDRLLEIKRAYDPENLFCFAGVGLD